jgi:hypothetical protein
VVSSSTGNSCGVLNSGTSYFSVRDATIFCTGSGSSLIGVQNSNASGFTSVKTSTIAGTTYDIMRTTGTLLLNATDLQNATSDGNGFSVNTSGSTLSFGMYNNGGLDSGQIQYLMPGTVAHKELPSTPFYNYFPQKLIIYGATASVQALSGARQIVVNYCKNNTSTIFMTLTLTSSNLYASVSGVSASFLTTDSLIVEIIPTGFSANDNLFFNTTLATY